MSGKAPSQEADEAADSFLAGPSRGCNCGVCVEELAHLLDTMMLKARRLQLDAVAGYLPDGEYKARRADIERQLQERGER